MASQNHCLNCVLRDCKFIIKGGKERQREGGREGGRDEERQREEAVKRGERDRRE